MSFEKVCELTIGVEDEFFGITRATAAETAARVLNGRVKYIGGAYDKYRCIDAQGRKWDFVTDSSIPADRAHQCEMNTPVLTWADMPTLRTLIVALREAGARVDKDRCGLHVHIGAAQLTPATVRNLVRTVRSHETLIQWAVGLRYIENGAEKVNPRLDDWCKPVDEAFYERLEAKRPTTFRELARAYYGTSYPDQEACEHYNYARYRLLNLHSLFYRADRTTTQWNVAKSTVEFRAFSATVDENLVEAYVLLSAGIVAQAIESKSATGDPAAVNTENPAFAMRTWLNRMGLMGKATRRSYQILVSFLPGNLAWRHGEPTKRTPYEEITC